jgi:hypothetical protein
LFEIEARPELQTPITQQMIVTVTDRNDDPKFAADQFQRPIFELHNVSQPIIRLDVEDPDPFQNMTFSFVGFSTGASGFFELVPVLVDVDPSNPDLQSRVAGTSSQVYKAVEIRLKSLSDTPGRSAVDYESLAVAHGKLFESDGTPIGYSSTSATWKDLDTTALAWLKTHVGYALRIQVTDDRVLKIRTNDGRTVTERFEVNPKEPQGVATTWVFVEVMDSPDRPQLTSLTMASPLASRRQEGRRSRYLGRT